MKKLTLAVLSLALLVGGASFVSAKDIAKNDVKKNIEEMNKLVEKYNKASDKKKPAIEKEIKAKVSENYEKHLKRMEERTAELEKRVTEMKTKLERMKSEEEKNKHIDEITKKIISGEKPMLFRPPFKEGENFKGPRHGMKGFHKDHKGMKCKSGDKGEKCPFAKGEAPAKPEELKK